MYTSTAADVLKNAIIDTVQQSNGGPTNLTLYSGSAGIYASIYSGLPEDIKSGITSVTYLSPGAVPGQGGLPGVESTTVSDPNAILGTYSYNSNIISGTSVLDDLVTGPVNGVNFNCGHDSNCLLGKIYLKLAARNSKRCPKRKLFDRSNTAGKTLPNFWGVNGLVLGWDPFDLLNQSRPTPTGNF